jgi:hypothetical protein
VIGPERHHHVVGGGEHLRLRLLGGHGAPFAGRALDQHDRSVRDRKVYRFACGLGLNRSRSIAIPIAR